VIANAHAAAYHLIGNYRGSVGSVPSLRRLKYIVQANEREKLLCLGYRGLKG